MRILSLINGRNTVTEVLEFEPLDDTSVRLITLDELLDIKITGIDIHAADTFATKLMTDGYADLSSYHAEYEKDQEDNEPEYETECPDCGTIIHFDQDVFDVGEITCPQCGNQLEFDETENTPETEDPTYLIECTCGAATKFSADVLSSGQAYCPKCFNKLGFDGPEKEPEGPEFTTSTTEKSHPEPVGGIFGNLFRRDHHLQRD